MLAVMDFHGPGVDMRLERIGRVRETGKFMRHGVLSLHVEKTRLRMAAMRPN
jgi:hypothetical protein